MGYVNQTRSTFPAEIAEIATSMRIEKRRPFDRPQVFRGVLHEFDEQYAQFSKHGGEGVLSQWRELSCTLGKHVRIQLRNASVEGVAKDLDDDGSLIVEEKGGGLRSVAYGDVTILR